MAMTPTVDEALELTAWALEAEGAIVKDAYHSTRSANALLANLPWPFTKPVWVANVRQTTEIPGPPLTARHTLELRRLSREDDTATQADTLQFVFSALKGITVSGKPFRSHDLKVDSDLMVMDEKGVVRRLMVLSFVVDAQRW